MKFLRIGGITLAAAALLSACGGGGSDTPPANQVPYTKLVSFGDSLSDVGTHAVSGIAAIGGGKYTVNAPGVKIWVERVAESLGVPAPCAAQTGLNAVQAAVGFPPAAVVNRPGCFDYAQGGSRVTNAIGVGNVATFPGQGSGALGQLTVPVRTQIENHLAAAGGNFTGTDLVTVLAGANDLFVQLGTVSATVAGGGNATTAGQAATRAMGQAGGELAAYIKALVVAKGAKRVVVVTVPDVSRTPFGLSQAQSTRDLIELMAFTFNAQVKFDLANVPEVLIVDGFQLFQNIVANPAAYGVTNVTGVACDPAKAPLGSLGCSAATVVAGNVSTYLFADAVHPTPLGYQLLAGFVTDALRAKGWL